MLGSMTKASAKIIVQFCFLQHCGLETARQPCPRPGIWQNCITARQLISNTDNFLLLIEVELSWHFPGGKEMEIVEKYTIQSHILIDSLTCTQKKTMQIAVARQQDPPTALHKLSSWRVKHTTKPNKKPNTLLASLPLTKT